MAATRRLLWTLSSSVPTVSVAGTGRSNGSSRSRPRTNRTVRPKRAKPFSMWSWRGVKNDADWRKRPGHAPGGGVVAGDEERRRLEEQAGERLGVAALGVEHGKAAEARADAGRGA